MRGSFRRQDLHQRFLHGAHIPGGSGNGLLEAIEHGIGEQGTVELDGAHGIVVSGNGIGDVVGVRIAVDDRHYGNAELVGFLDGNGFLYRVDHEKNVGKAAQLPDAAQGAVELVALAFDLEQFLLGEAHIILGQQFIELAQTADGDGRRFPVGQHTAEPAVVDIVLAAALGGLGNGAGGLTLGADEEHPAARGGHVTGRLHRPIEHGNRLLEVDNMNLVANAEDKRRHFRIPAAGVMTEVNAGLK